MPSRTRTPRPRVTDGVAWTLKLPAAQLDWLDSQRSLSLHSRAAVLRHLIAQAMSRQAQEG